VTRTFHELYQLFPKLDCGLCGNPSCRTTARKLATGEATIEQCVNLGRPEFQQNRERILGILKEGVEIGAKGTIVIDETGVTYIHPCVSEAGRVAAESKLSSGPEGTVDLKFGFFDPMMICWALNAAGLFTDVRCSPNLGVARVNIGDKTVMVSKDGRINVRRARDKKDAVETIRLISRSLWGAIICSCCGNAGVDCASGGCEDCLTRVCPVIAGGPPDPTGSKPGPTEQTTASTIFDRAKALPTSSYFDEGSERLDEALEIVMEIGERMLKGSPDMKLIERARQKISEVNKLAIRFVVETPRVQDATIGLILAGVALDVNRMAEAVNMLAQQKTLISNELKNLLRRAVEVATEAYWAYREVNADQAKRAIDKYTTFRKKWTDAFRESSEKEALVAVEKLAVNGFYIARLLTKPLPA